MNTPKKPNIVVVLSDQLRRDALGVYGDPNVSTPNIDCLARSGARFSAFSSTYPVCVPFRFTMMTGQYAHSRFIPAIEWRMSPSERTIADEFNEAGYRTIYIGKWHLHGGAGCLPNQESPKARVSAIPKIHQGRWKVWRGFELANAPFETYYFKDDDPTPNRIQGYQTDGLFDLGFKTMEESIEAGDPFFTIISVEPPHFPKEVPSGIYDRWIDRDIQLPKNFMVSDDYRFPGEYWTKDRYADAVRQRRLYYGMIENLDDNMGKLIQFLREKEVAGNTYVVLCSDHGEMGGAHSQNPSEKMHPWEESIGIPFIVSGPAVPSGTVIGVPAATEDIFPTLLGLAGLKRNREYEKLPGKDLSPCINGEEPPENDEGVLLEFVHDFRNNRYGIYYNEYWRGFRTNRYKYIVLGNMKDGGKPHVLFDLVADPLEMDNLIHKAEYADIAASLHKKMRARMIGTDDHYVLAPSYGCEGLNLWHKDQ